MEKDSPPSYEEVVLNQQSTVNSDDGHHKQPPPLGLPPSTSSKQTNVENRIIKTHILSTTMGTKSVTMECPYCYNEINTNVETTPNTQTYLWSALLCSLCGILCAFIPCCIDSCQQQNHICPECGKIVGKNNI